MNEIRQEIEVLLKQYEKQYKCSEEELRNIKEKRKRGRLILYVLNIAATLSCTISVVNMLDIIALQITSEQSNLSFTMISCAIVAALTICLLLLMEITKNHYRINNSVPKEYKKDSKKIRRPQCPPVRVRRIPAAFRYKNGNKWKLQDWHIRRRKNKISGSVHDVYIWKRKAVFENI